MLIKTRPSPLVIPSEAQGPAVSLNQHPMLTNAPPSPLSSRAKPRDLQFAQPAPNAHQSTTRPFVIPSEAEGSAVRSTSTQCSPKHHPPLCHPERSRGICGSLDQHQMLTKAPPSPLSSRAKPRDLQFAQPAPNADQSATLPFVTCNTYRSCRSADF
jgi:hypothetical protein